PDAVGTYDYLYRYSTTNGRDWLYADLNGPVGNTAAPPPNPGVLTVTASSDTSAPAVPANVHVVTAGPTAIELAWNAVAGDPTLYGYEVLRGGSSGGPYAKLALVTGTDYVDSDVAEASTQLEYKYTLGDWDHVEKDGSCGEIGNRALTLTYGSSGTQTVGDTVENWRNVAPCGN